MAACPWPVGKTPKKHQDEPMSRLLQTADEHWQPMCASRGGCWQRAHGRPAQRAAARLVLALVRWQIRRLERRIAALEVDDAALN
jgi:hypothetical protein